jgi:short-subunit dehydrogenase
MPSRRRRSRGTDRAQPRRSTTGVTVTSLMPGPTETEFFWRADMEDNTRIGQMENKDDARAVARDGYDALMAGRSSVVAGSFTDAASRRTRPHLPDALAAPILARLTKPQTETIEEDSQITPSG